MTEEIKKAARDLALGRLTFREYSAAEMRAYLRRKGTSEEIADEVVSALVQDGTVDDRRYARAVARAQSTRGKGARYVLAKLRQKGVRTDLAQVTALVGEVADVSELERARQIVERRYPGARSDRQAAARAFQALLRRGFSAEAARQALAGTTELIDIKR